MNVIVESGEVAAKLSLGSWRNVISSKLPSLVWTTPAEPPPTEGHPLTFVRVCAYCGRSCGQLSKQTILQVLCTYGGKQVGQLATCRLCADCGPEAGLCVPRHDPST